MLAATCISAESLNGKKQFRVAMSAAFVSETGVEVYEKIVAYLAQKTGIEGEFVTGLAYDTINLMLESGHVDFGFVCGLPYVLAHDRSEPAVYLIGAPVMQAKRYGNQPKYYSNVIVRKGAPYQKLEDLVGKIFVYNEELSNSGYNMARYEFIQKGLHKKKGFFGDIKRSGSHEESIRMVAQGEADYSFVDSLVLDYDRKNGFGHASGVRVIDTVGPAGIPPIVVSNQVDQAKRNMIQHYLLNMHQEPEGRKILDSALVSHFVEVDDSNYDDIRHMNKVAEEEAYIVIEKR